MCGRKSFQTPSQTRTEFIPPKSILKIYFYFVFKKVRKKFTFKKIVQKSYEYRQNIVQKSTTFYMT